MTAGLILMASHLTEVREADVILIGMLLLCWATYARILRPDVLLYWLLRKQMLSQSERREMMWPNLHALLITLGEELVTYQQRHGDVFAMCGSFPNAPGILTVALFGGATLSAAVCGNDFESVRLDLILQYQDIREAQIQSYFSRQTRKEVQRRLDEEQHHRDELECKKGLARKKAQLSFDAHAIEQRDYANPHMDHCPLRTKLYVMCECYSPTSTLSNASHRSEMYATQRNATPFRHEHATRRGDIHASSWRESARSPAFPLYALNASAVTKQPKASPAQSYVYSLQERESALAKLRASLNLSGPRTSPQELFAPFTYNWTEYPEVRNDRDLREQALRNAMAAAQRQATMADAQSQVQFQAQGLWSGYQSSHYHPQMVAGSDITAKLNIPLSVSAQSPIPATFLKSIIQAPTRPAAMPTQPILNSNKQAPNGVASFVMV